MDASPISSGSGEAPFWVGGGGGGEGTPNDMRAIGFDVVWQRMV